MECVDGYILSACGLTVLWCCWGSLHIQTTNLEVDNLPWTISIVVGSVHVHPWTYMPWSCPSDAVQTRPYLSAWWPRWNCVGAPPPVSHYSAQRVGKNPPETRYRLRSCLPPLSVGHDATTHPSIYVRMRSYARPVAQHRPPTSEYLLRITEQVPVPVPTPFRHLDPLSAQQTNRQVQTLSRRQRASHQRLGAVRRPHSSARLSAV